MVQQVTLKWTDTSCLGHAVEYSVTGDELRRDNGIETPLVMATGVVANSISFTLCGNTLRVNMDVQADRNTTDKLDLITYMRKLS